MKEHIIKRLVYFLLLFFSLDSLSAKGNAMENDFNITSKMKKNRKLALALRNISLDSPFFYYIFLLDDGIAEVVLNHPIENIPSNQFVLEYDELLYSQYKKDFINTTELYNSVMKMNEKEIKEKFFSRIGGLKVLDYPELEFNNEFRLALIKKGFYLYIGDEAGYIFIQSSFETRKLLLLIYLLSLF